MPLAHKSFLLTDELAEYIVGHSSPPDDVQRDLIAETAALGPWAGMQISPEQGVFMAMLVRLSGARHAIEIGTFTGYSALAMAQALPADGTLLCCDVNTEWTAIARRHWERAGVDHKIDLRIGPALDTLQALGPDRRFDLAFVDADKPNYAAYYDELIPRLSPGGLLLVDNVLWSGHVVDETSDERNTRALRAFNDMVAADHRVDVVLLPIADGLTLARRR